jgi:hypothetical protein
MKAGDLIKLRQTPDGRYLDIYNDARGAGRWESIGKCFPGDIGLVVDPKVDLYATFSAGCLAVALWMAYNSNKKIKASAGLKRAAGMLIVSDGKILGFNRGEDGWALPVVKLRNNEDFVTAAHRAVLDKTGWTVKLINKIQPFSFWEEKDGYLIQIFIATPGIDTMKKIKNGQSCWIGESLLSEGKYCRFNEKMLDYFSKYR